MLRGSVITHDINKPFCVIKLDYNAVFDIVRQLRNELQFAYFSEDTY